MALARVVTFEGVSKDRMDEMGQEIEQGEPPEGMPPAEIIVLHEALHTLGLGENPPLSAVITDRVAARCGR